MNWSQMIKLGVAAVGAGLSYVFGGWDKVLTVLVVFTVVDYATGFVAAGLAGELSSSVGFRGIARKMGIWLIVMIGALVDMVLGQDHMIRDAAVWWYLANELLSIVENAGRIGVPIPPVITNAIAILRKKDAA